MIHLLVGSYVKKPFLVFFSDWSRNNAYETLRSYWLSYFNLNSGQKEENKMAETNRDFSEDEFSAASVEALWNFHYDFLKVEQIECLQWVLICVREDILAADGFRERCWSVWKMIDSDDTNKFIVTVLQIVNCPQSWLQHSNLVREKESNNWQCSLHNFYKLLEDSNLHLHLQSNQVKRTPQDFINELIIWNLNPLVVSIMSNELIIWILNSLVRSEKSIHYCILEKTSRFETY